MGKAGKAVMFVTGFGLLVFPEPVTTVFGVLLILATFGLEDKAPV